MRLIGIVVACLGLIGCSSTDEEPGSVQPGVTVPGGPYQHKVLSASSIDGLNWARDQGVRIDHASVPCAVSDANRIILYYVDADRGPGLPESVGCAVSQDGIQFQKQNFFIENLAVTKAVDPSILRDQDGKYRLYYLASSVSGDPASDTLPHEIHLALSDDGIRFQSAGNVFRYAWLVDPDVFAYQGTWFMYVFSKNQTIIATSSDGKSFVYKQAMVPQGWGTVAPVVLDDGRLRLYAFDQRTATGNAVRSFISSNGIDWVQEPGERLVGGKLEQITDPYVVRWKGSYKMYFKSDQR